MKCPQCHRESPAGMRFCGHCGTSFPATGPGPDVSLTQTLILTPGVMPDGTLFAGRYLVMDDLGKGGMGHVYRVLDTKIDEEVALKFINPEVAADIKVIERFRNELKTTRKITHRHVCRMYDLGEEAQSLFITMEYVAGEDLAHMVHRLERLPVEKAFLIARQVCEGLAEVHRLGVVHRDLTLKNIMIGRDGNAKIMDFGLARTPHGIRLTEVGQVVGTPHFMSPEQIDGVPVDQRSDIFALGIIMFAMLTGRLPFVADSTLALALLHKTHRPPNPNAIDPRVPRELGQVILRCLEVDRAKRYQTAEELLSALDKIGESFDTYALAIRAGDSKQRPAVPGPGALSWRRVIVAGAAVLVLAVSGMAIRSYIKKAGMKASFDRRLREIDGLIADGQFPTAFRTALDLEREIPGDVRVAALWPRISSALSVRTTPPGARVSWKDGRTAGEDFQAVGPSPVDGIRVPLGPVTVRVEMEDYGVCEDAAPEAGGTLNFLLPPKGSRKAGMDLAWIDEIAQIGGRIAYKVNAGVNDGVRAGDQGTVFSAKGGPQVPKDLVIARFLVRGLQRDRASIEVHSQKAAIQLGDLVRFDEIVTTVPVTIETEPGRASLYIDEALMGLSGDTVNLAPGRHSLKLVKPGYKTQTMTLDVDTGGRSPLMRRYMMTPESPALPPKE